MTWTENRTLQHAETCAVGPFLPIKYLTTEAWARSCTDRAASLKHNFIALQSGLAIVSSSHHTLLHHLQTSIVWLDSMPVD